MGPHESLRFHPSTKDLFPEESFLNDFPVGSSSQRGRRSSPNWMIGKILSTC